MTTDNEDKIRAAIEARADAIRNKDVPGVTPHFTEDSVGFSLAPPLQTKAPLKADLKDWFATFRGPIGLEMRDLKITAGEDVAYCHSLTHLSGEKVDGEKTDVWLRETLCFQNIDGRWLITHTHESVPFYMDGSFKAAIDLKP